jgi:hypothetical protein
MKSAPLLALWSLVLIELPLSCEGQLGHNEAAFKPNGCLNYCDSLQIF